MAKNTAFFIARKLIGKDRRASFSLILKIEIAAIALSLAIMLLASSMINGFKYEIRDKVFGFWGHIHIMKTGIHHSYEANPISKNQSFYPFLDTVGRVEYRVFDENATVPFVEDETHHRLTKGGFRKIQPFTLKPVIINTKSDFEGIVLKGIDVDYDTAYISRHIEEGEMVNLADTSTKKQLLVSRYTANRLELEIGDRVIVHFVKEGQQIKRRCSIHGIFKTGLEEYDKKFALTNMKVLQDFLGWQDDEVSGFEIFLDDIDDMPIMKEFLYAEVLPFELFAETIREKDPSIFDWLELQDINEQVIFILMLIVAVINAITALLIIIIDRTTMIGVLKSLGSTNWVIQKIFLYFSGYVILIGLLLGNILGLGLAYVQDSFKILKLAEEDYYLKYVPIHWDVVNIVGINIGAFFIITLCLILPSFYVLSIHPIKALRFK